MTTGSKVVDGRFSVNTDCGPGYLGHYFEKTWSGTDRSRPDETEPHPYNCYLRETHDDLLSWSLVSSPGSLHSGTADSCGFAPSFSYATPDENWELKAIGKLLEKIRGHDFNAAVNVGEARESVRMVGDIARSLASAVVNLKRGNFVGALKNVGLAPKGSRVRDLQSRARDSLATAWLGLTYGVRPMLGAAADAATALAANVQHGGKLNARVTHKFPGTVFGVGGGFSARGSATTRLQIIFSIDAYESALSELAIVRPETVAWELLTLSFVADWFIPIGDYLDALTNVRGLEGTYVRTLTKSARVTLGTSPSYVIHSGGCLRREVQVARTVGRIKDYGVPLPRFKNPLSVSHALSGIALFHSLTRHR